MHLAHYLGLLHRAELALADAYEQTAQGHAAEADVHHVLPQFAAACRRHAEELAPAVERYGEDAPEEPDRLHSDIFRGNREGGLGLLRDLQDLLLMATEADVAWTLIGQAAQGLRDADLKAVVDRCDGETAVQLKWLRGHMKVAAPQALVVA
jgi:hypothetical protein